MESLGPQIRKKAEQHTKDFRLDNFGFGRQYHAHYSPMSENESLPAPPDSSGAIAKGKRILVGVAMGVVVLVSGIWVLARSLGNDRLELYHGATLEHWIAQAGARDGSASNAANAILVAEIIPRLTNAMFHDTNDSSFRLTLVEALNDLPGILIFYTRADGRRAGAAVELGQIGPAAGGAIPALIQAVQGHDPATRGSAARALGQIRSEPDIVIPFLTKYLDDEDINDEAALALGEFGTLARAAVPKIIPLLRAKDKESRAAAATALKKIDPTAYAKAMDETRAGP
jgi:hypothetical protein